MEEIIKVDFRKHYIETREVRDGNAMYLQGRTKIQNLDGSIDHTEWVTTCVITNYGDVFDPKPTLWGRLVRAFGRGHP